MAVLDNNDFTFYKHALRNDPVAKAQRKAASLSKAQLQAAFQAVEDWFEGQRATIKGDMDAASGVTLTPVMARKIAKVWMMRKLGGE